MEEIWKEIKRYTGPYKANLQTNIKVSNLGNAEGEMNYKKHEITIKKGRRYFGCYPIYTLVWEAFNGPIPKGYVIHHKDHNKLNDRLDNLQLMTNGEHTKHHHTNKIVTEEVKQHMSEAQKGKFISEETKQKLREANIGKKHSEETKQKMRGRKFSEEHKRKISESVKNAWKLRK